MIERNLSTGLLFRFPFSKLLNRSANSIKKRVKDQKSLPNLFKLEIKIDSLKQELNLNRSKLITLMRY